MKISMVAAFLLAVVVSPCLAQDEFQSIDGGMGDQSEPSMAVVQASVEELIKKGMSLVREKDYSGALAVFEQVKKEDPQLIHGYIGAGIANYHLGKYDMAVNSFTRAVSIAPENPRSYLWLGVSYKALGDAASAKAVLLKWAGLLRKVATNQVEGEKAWLFEKIVE